MGFRFHKSFRIFPGFRLNLGKRGVSASLGGKGATVNVSGRGTRTTLGIPGTGLSWTSSSSSGARSSPGKQSSGIGCLPILLVLTGVPLSLLGLVSLLGHASDGFRGEGWWGALVAMALGGAMVAWAGLAAWRARASARAEEERGA